MPHQVSKLQAHGVSRKHCLVLLCNDFDCGRASERPLYDPNETTVSDSGRRSRQLAAEGGADGVVGLRAKDTARVSNVFLFAAHTFALVGASSGCTRAAWMLLTSINESKSAVGGGGAHLSDASTSSTKERPASHLERMARARGRMVDHFVGAPRQPKPNVRFITDRDDSNCKLMFLGRWIICFTTEFMPSTS